MKTITKVVGSAVLSLSAAVALSSEYDYRSTQTIHIFKGELGVVAQHSDKVRTSFAPIHEVVLDAQPRMVNEKAAEFKADWELQLITPGATKTLWLDGAELTDGERSTMLTPEELAKIVSPMEDRFAASEHYPRRVLDARKVRWVNGEAW